MKNIKKLIVPLLVIAFLLSGCSDASNDEENVVENTEDIQTETVSGIDLVVNPSVEYIVAGLSQVESVIRIEKDPDGGQGDNVVATVYFSSDIVDQNKFDENETTSEKGTQSGGSIDIFSNEEDAIARDKYLKKFDGKWVFDSGSHTVLGTIVIRASSLLDEEDQALLTSQISEVLTSGDITEDMVEEASKKLQEDERLRQKRNKPLKIESG